jgi:hypothetical protein
LKFGDVNIIAKSYLNRARIFSVVGAVDIEIASNNLNHHSSFVFFDYGKSASLPHCLGQSRAVLCYQTRAG